MNDSHIRSNFSLAYLTARFYSKWRSLLNSGKPISVEWRKNTPGALEDFSVWMGKHYEEKTPGKSWGAWHLGRIDETKDYGPNNCKLVSRRELMKKSPAPVVTDVLKTALKEHRQTNPHESYKQTAAHFKPYSYGTIYALIRNMENNEKIALISKTLAV